MGRLGRLYRLFRYFHNIDNIGVIELQRLNPIMQKLIVLVALATMLTFVSSSTAAQSLIDGHWEGVMVREGSELTVSSDFSAEASGIRGSFNSPALHALRIPLRNVTYNAPNVHFLATSRRSFLTANCRPLRLPGNSVKVLIETGSSRKAMPGAECSTKVRLKVILTEVG